MPAPANSVTGVQSAPDVIGDIHAKPAIKSSDQFGRSRAAGPAPLQQRCLRRCRQGLTYGNAGRNILPRPQAHQLRRRHLFKNFTVREGMHFELRGEGFNVFNHTQWSAINSTACYGAANCSGDAFLTATAAHSARKLQVAGKFVF